ncbi:MAG TPA: MlaD family protein [Marinobacter sp.]|nr:MlaD family protein [Marinobacter sp.]
MEPKAHHAIIGLFTIIAFAAALIFALWLGKSNADREWTYYQIGFDQAVSGLAKGNPVLYSGVHVGDVLEMNLDLENPSHVRVLVRVDRRIPIREDTQAGLVLANITGSMNIQFSGGSPNSPILEGDKNNPPLIMAKPSTFSNLLENGEELLKKADLLLTNANRLFSSQNTEDLTAILANTREGTDALLSHRDELSALLEQFAVAGKRAEEAANKVSQVSTNANNLLQTKGAPVLEAMEQALISIQTVTSRIDNMTLENEGAINSGLQGMGELAPALRELRNTLRSLNRFARKLDEDPSGIIWGGESIRELSK